MKRKKRPLLMVGPDLEGLGGISRVARIWREGGLFSQHRIRYIGTPSGLGVKSLCLLLKALAVFVALLPRGCEAVYIHTAAQSSFFRKSIFMMVAWLFGRPVVLHIHPAAFYDFLKGLTGRGHRFVFFAMRLPVCLVVLTEEMKSLMSALFPGKPIFVIANGIDVREANTHATSRREPRRLLYLGWYVREKGVYDLVDAIKILIDDGYEVKLDFYGTKQVKELGKYVSGHDLDQWISVRGWIGDGEKFMRLSASTALVLPTYSEGLPNVVLEAMATKTPIIATRVGGLKEVLRPSENAFIVEARNPRDLSEKIRLCIENEELRNRIAEAGYRDAVTKYDIPIIRREFAELMGWVEANGTART